MEVRLEQIADHVSQEGVTLCSFDVDEVASLTVISSPEATGINAQRIFLSLDSQLKNRHV